MKSEAMEKNTMASTHQIGERLIINGRKVMVQQATDQCEGCFLYDLCVLNKIENPYIIQCIGSNRPDNRDIIYKEI